MANLMARGIFLLGFSASAATIAVNSIPKYANRA